MWDNLFVLTFLYNTILGSLYILKPGALSKLKLNSIGSLKPFTIHPSITLHFKLILLIGIILITFSDTHSPGY